VPLTQTLTLYRGEDKSFPLTVYTDTTKATVKEITGWTVELVVRERDDSPGTALLTVSASVSGTFNADPDTNTQVATATLSDDQTLTLPIGTYRYSFRRTDAGSEGVLALGDFVVKEATGR